MAGPMAFARDDPDALLNPRVVIEVQWSSAVKADRYRNFRRYYPIASFQEYVLVEPDEPAVDCDTRQSASDWSFTRVGGLDAVVRLASVNAEVRAVDISDGVTFPDPSPR